MAGSWGPHLLPANGLEITDGTLENVAFWFDVTGGKSVGEIRAVWHDLSLRLVDPVTGEQNFGQKLKSVMARMLSKSDNQPDRKGRLEPVRIKYDTSPTDAFWGLFWRSLRSGLVTAMKNQAGPGVGDQGSGLMRTGGFLAELTRQPYY